MFKFIKSMFTKSFWIAPFPETLPEVCFDCNKGTCDGCINIDLNRPENFKITETIGKTEFTWTLWEKKLRGWTPIKGSNSYYELEAALYSALSSDLKLQTI